MFSDESVLAFAYLKSVGNYYLQRNANKQRETAKPYYSFSKFIDYVYADKATVAELQANQFYDAYTFVTRQGNARKLLRTLKLNDDVRKTGSYSSLCKMLDNMNVKSQYSQFLSLSTARDADVLNSYLQAAETGHAEFNGKQRDLTDDVVRDIDVLNYNANLINKSFAAARAAVMPDAIPEGTTIEPEIIPENDIAPMKQIVGELNSVADLAKTVEP